MKRALRFLLLMGAMIGLFGQQSAYAFGPTIIEPLLTQSASGQVDQDMGMMDCAEMMAQHPAQPAKEQRPCKGLTLACIAQMGCTVPVLLGSAPVAVSIAAIPPVTFEVAMTPRLSGRAVTPEPDPPTA